MPRFHGFILIALLFAPPAFAAEATTLKLQAFKAAKVTLAGKIDAFLLDVKACNPPVEMAKNQILEKFGGPKPDSAKNSLNTHELDVTKHATIADASFGAIEQSSRGCGDKTQLLNLNDSAREKVLTGLAEDMANFQKGTDEANKKKAQLIYALDMRQKNITNPLLPVGNVKSCDSAKAKVNEMEDANKDLAKALADLKASYQDKANAEVVAINASKSCGSASPVKKVSFEAPEAEPDEGSAGIAI